MNKINLQNIQLFNENVRFESPNEIISFAIEQAEKPIITTSFGPYSAALLQAVTQVKPNIPIIWCDTGYNTKATYQHVHYLTEKLQLNLKIYTPQYTTAYLESKIGKPLHDNPMHATFSEETKLGPFKRALADYKPDVWFTNIRNGQTDLRNRLNVFSFTNDAILKVSPFYHFDDKKLSEYIQKRNLPLEFDYFDPVKALAHRECGIHFT